MKGNSTIRIDYDNVLQQASRLSAIAASCGDVENRLRSAITMLTPAWEGPSGEACRAALQSRISEVRALRSQVEQMAAYIRKVAAEFQEAERRAAAAARAAAIAGSAAASVAKTEKKQPSAKGEASGAASIDDIGKKVSDFVGGAASAMADFLKKGGSGGKTP